ncbi:MAG: cell division topological specificity factor MinE [Clostridia bacterium]|jgi:cell division topological specificity factor|nr:cell division topological specificity factor MinE [Clostridiales bacterium]
MDFFRSNVRKSASSKNIAKERLKLVLVHDRVNVSPTFLEMIKGDIIRVISDYMEIDEDNLEVKMTKTKSDEDESMVPALVANIPIKRMKGAAR